MQPRAGVCLEDRYFLMKILGVGGTSTVFLAMDERIQRKRAIKAVKKEIFSEHKFWKQESLILKRLHHEHIAEIFDVLEDQDFFYLVMEYVEGCTLRRLLETGRCFSVRQTAAIGEQICEILSFLHGQKIPVIYGDLKPENLMMEKSGRIVLIDFGASEFSSTKQRETCWGTESYAAPEQKEKNGKTDARSDIYSLGIILYELLYGEVFLRNKVEQSKDEMDQIIEKCTRCNQDERYQKAEEVAESLEIMDLVCRKSARRYKYRGFLAGFFWSVSIFFLVLSECFSQQAAHLIREGYEQYMKAGERQPEREERVEALKRAVELNPWRPEAYFALLEEYRNEIFSSEEYREFLELLERENKAGISYEMCLEQSKEAYGRFCYEMGIACYFEWEHYGNKKYAVSWLDQAAVSVGLSEEERETASSLASIAAYHGRLKKQGEELSYPEKKMILQYWEDLKKMVGMTQNISLRKMICRETVGQIIQYLSAFKESGVSLAEVRNCLEQIGQENQELETVIQEGVGLLEAIETTG